MITQVQPPAAGTFEGNSGSATLAATEAGSQIIIIAGVVGDGANITKVTTPSGFGLLGLPGFGDAFDYASVQVFIKTSASAGETSWTLALTNAASRRVNWVALEMTGLDLDWSYSAYVPAIGEASGTTTPVTSKSMTATSISETYSGLSLACFAATNTGGVTPTISGHSNGFTEIASQSGTDANSRAATLSVATKAEMAVNTPTTTVSVSPSSYVGGYIVVLTALDALHATNVTVMSGAEIGTATNITTTGLGTATGTLAPFDGVVGTPAVVSTSPRSGAYCFELSSTAAAENLTWVAGAGKNLQTSTVSTWSERFDVYFPTSLPSGDTELASCEVSSLANGMVIRYVSASQKIGVKIGTGTEVLSDTTVSAGQWIGIDYLYDPRTTTHTCQWAVDYNANTADTTPGVLQTAASTSGMTAGGVTTVRHGWTTSITATVRYDDIVGSRFRKTFPIGDVRIRPLKADAAGTITVNGTSGNFRTFTANGGTLTAITSANVTAALRDFPPTIGASADGLAQITNAVTDYVEIPMETVNLAANSITPICGRWYWAGWAASGNPATFKFRPYDTVFGNTVTTVYGDTLDAGFDNTVLTWMGMVHNTNAALNYFYPLTQVKLDALAVQFGFSEDVNPDAGVHAVLFELAERPVVAQTLFGSLATATADPVTGGISTVSLSAPTGYDTSLYYEQSGSPTTVPVTGGTSHDETLNAPDAPTTNYIAAYPAAEPDPV